MSHVERNKYPGGEVSGIPIPIPVISSFADGAQLDAFGRQRVSSPESLFDSKQLWDNMPLFWDDQEVSGGSTASSHSVDTASTTIGVALNTAGKRVRQTFMRFNYQPGKSQEIFMTGVLGAGASGITQEIGAHDDENGLFFKCDGGVMNVTRRTFVTGSAVDVDVAQSTWSLDKMDGTGDSGVTIDFTKSQIFVIDYEWLGVGRTRFGFNINGTTIYCHEMQHSNDLSVVYISTPNLPLRYSIENDGTGVATTLQHICSTVISEGGQQDNGILRYTSTSGTHIDANVENTVYAIVGIRLKTTHLDARINLVDISLQEAQGSKFYEWFIVFNPTVASTFAYGNETDSAIQSAKGATTNTVTGGTIISGGYASSAQKGGEILSKSVETIRRLGAAIDGARDEIVLCVRPVGASTNIDIEGSITWREMT